MTEQETQDSVSRIEIEGPDGLVLRRLVVEDAEAYFAIIEENPDYLRQQHEGGQDPTADKYPDLESVRKSILEPDNLDKVRFGVWSGEEMVASVNLTPLEGDTVEVGYMSKESQQGKGYATRAVQAACDYAFRSMGAGKIFGQVFIGNEASRHVLEKVGFIYTGVIERIDDKTGRLEKLWAFKLEKHAATSTA